MNDAPGYVDLQVNGYAGVDLNQDDLPTESLHAMCMRLRADGVAGILATIVTDELEVMERRLRRLAALWAADSLARDVIWGIHIEGPFINGAPGFLGAHLANAVRPAEPDAMQRLLDAAGGLVRMVTLAPECDANLRVTRLLAGQGIVVSAGHCDPSLDLLRAAIDAGLSMFTHLGNACPTVLPRHDNIIQRVLSQDERLSISFIADGVHVPFMALGNYLRCAGLNRCVIVTDAISAAGLGPGTYPVGSQMAEVDTDLIAWAPGRARLIGSTSTMPRMAKNLRDRLQLSEAEVRQLLCDNPRRVLDRRTYHS